MITKIFGIQLIDAVKIFGSVSTLLFLHIVLFLLKEKQLIVQVKFTNY